MPNPQLLPGDIHLWFVDLDLSAPQLQRLTATLSPEELAQADRFIKQQHGDRYRASHGWLRDVLARYLLCAPGAIEYEQGLYGKPYIKGVSSFVHFNLSHSHSHALIAVMAEQEVGVDIEYLNPTLQVMDLAKRFFSDREVAQLESLAADVQREAFFRCWTRKEAYIKALGKGLFISLKSFSVSVKAAGFDCLLEIDGDEKQANNWCLGSVSLENEHYIAAVATHSPIRRVIAWNLS